MPVSDFDFSGGPVPDWLVALLSQMRFTVPEGRAPLPPNAMTNPATPNALAQYGYQLGDLVDRPPPGAPALGPNAMTNPTTPGVLGAYGYGLGDLVDRGGAQGATATPLSQIPMGMPGRAYGPPGQVPGALAIPPDATLARVADLPIPMGMPGRSVAPPAPAAAPAGGWPLPPEKPAPRASERLRGPSSKSRYGQYVPDVGDAQHQHWAYLDAADPRIYRGRA